MFPSKLKELRARHKISQADLASILGVAQQTVASWESGKSSPNYALLIKIAGYFHVTTDFLLRNPDTSPPSDPTAPHESMKDAPAPPSYYNDPEVAAMAEELRTRPGLRVLFDASKDLRKEDIEFVLQMVERMRGQGD